MIKKYFSLLTLAFAFGATAGFSGCGQKKAAVATDEQVQAAKTRVEEKRTADVARIDSLEAGIRSEVKQHRDPDTRLGMYTIQAYEYYAKDFPKDSLAPEYLFKAGQLYEGVLRDYKKAITVYDTLTTRYPDFNKRGMAMFLKGHLYQELNDTTKAIQEFNAFRKEYPKHEFADDAQGLINLMRMSEADRKRMFGGGMNPKKPV